MLMLAGLQQNIELGSNEPLLILRPEGECYVIIEPGSHKFNLRKEYINAIRVDESQNLGICLYMLGSYIKQRIHIIA